MYTDSIYRDLDKIGNLHFVSILDGILYLDIPPATRVFLRSIPSLDFANVDFTNIALIRNSQNSIKNRINPEFIKKLKKTLAFALHYLKNNWKEIENNNDGFMKIEKSERIIALTSTSFDNHLSSQISSMYKLTGKLTISLHHNIHKTITIEAEPKDLSSFMNILRMESEQASLKIYDCPATRLFMCIKNDEKWMETSPLLKELIQKIAKTMYFHFVGSLEMPVYIESGKK